MLEVSSAPLPLRVASAVEAICTASEISASTWMSPPERRFAVGPIRASTSWSNTLTATVPARSAPISPFGLPGVLGCGP